MFTPHHIPYHKLIDQYDNPRHNSPQGPTTFLQVSSLERRNLIIVFGHWGFGVDTLLVAARLLNRHTTWMTETSPLLGFLRVWRILRLVQTYVTIETKKYIATKRELSRQRVSVEELEKKATALESDLEHERIIRKQNEDLTKQCQDEIETLREALKIAAQDVALALRGDFDNVMLDPPGGDEIRGLVARSISPVEGL